MTHAERPSTGVTRNEEVGIDSDDRVWGVLCDGNVNILHVLELGAEEEGGEK